MSPRASGVLKVLARALLLVAWVVAQPSAAQAPSSAIATGVTQAASPLAQHAKACTGCHGDQGQSRPDGYVPRLAGKPAGYLHAQLIAFRDGQRVHTGMATLLQPLDDAMLGALAAHFAGLSLPYPPPAATLPAQSSAEAARAQALVRQGDPARRIPACAACHGTALTGIAPQVPGLLGLPADYIGAQLGAWRNLSRHARAPDCMAEVASRLPLEDVSRVARWLAAQPVPSGGQPATTAPAQWPMDCGGGAESQKPPGAQNAPPAHASQTRQAANAAQSTQTQQTLQNPQPPPTPPTPQVARGAYLALVGNCAGCHTAPGGPAMAGGKRLSTPYGTVITTNLTPDPVHGLGRWTADDFHRAMHEGRSRDGRRLVPAFPYTSFTQVAREDNDALFAWLRSLPAVPQANRPHELRFPYGTQAAITAWQWLNFRPAAPRAQAPQAGLERGAYLVQGLGHCAECHAPRDRWLAPGGAMTGAEMGREWAGEPGYAPSLLPLAGRPAQAAEDIALLQTGVNRSARALGAMAKVVLDSTQHWTAPDLAAAVAYLHSLPAQAAPATQARHKAAEAANAAALSAGGRLYAKHCASCHGEQGEGRAGAAGPLAGNPSLNQPSVRHLVQVLRHGAFSASTQANPQPHGMPPAELGVQETAQLLSWMRQSWGHRAPAVTPLEVMRAQ